MHGYKQMIFKEGVQLLEGIQDYFEDYDKLNLHNTQRRQSTLHEYSQ